MNVDNAVSIGAELLSELTCLGSRPAGTDDEAAAADIVRKYFEQIGLSDIHNEPFEFPGCEPTGAMLTVKAEPELSLKDPHQIVALSGSPKCSIDGQLRDMGYGLAEDYEGQDVTDKIVLVTDGTPDDHPGWEHRMYRYGLAVEAGAAGFVLVSDLEGCLPRTGEVGFGRRPAPIPAVGISAEDGFLLRNSYETNCPLKLKVDARNGSSESRNVIARTGPSNGPETVLCAHYDSHDIGDGALDNAFGCAVLVSTAVLLNELKLSSPVRFIAFGAEEIGHYGAERHMSGMSPSDVNCVINLDGIGYSENPMLQYNRFTEFREHSEAVTNEQGHYIEYDESIQLYGDQWVFCRRGIPSVMVGSVSEGRGWTHTHADTLDKVDIDYLVPLTEFVAAFVERLSSDTLSQRSPSVVRMSLNDQHRFELEAGGRWPPEYDAN